MVGYVGVIGQQEGIEYLLKAAKYIKEELHRNDIFWGVVGGGPHLEALRKQSHEMGLDDILEFTGRVSDEVLLGEDWLVHHSGFDYRLWTREIIAKAEVEQKKLSSDDGILKIYTKGHSVPEELPVTSAGKVNSIVTAWLNNELTA